jgi:hypothetical protein
MSIDAAYFRDKVRVCLRLAEGLPWNSPVRYQLLQLAEDFQLRGKELEAAAQKFSTRIVDGDTPSSR